MGGEAPCDHDGGGGQAGRAMIRRGSRLTDTRRPLVVSNTSTPTGEVSTRTSIVGPGAAFVSVGDGDVAMSSTRLSPNGSARLS